jgi:hypothetical protein
MPSIHQPRARRRAGLIVGAALALEAGGLWLQSHKLAGEVVVRCSRGHLFTTIWIPGVSVKSLRLVWRRFQRCPVGGHWSLVTPLDESKLTEDERRLAHEHHDIRLP